MRKLLAALTTGAMILALAACGGAGTDSKEEEPLPTAPMEVATNPLVGPLAAFLEQKDLSYAGALGRMDAYTPGETDITPLLEGISADLAAAESQLYEAITVAYEAVQGEDGVWTLTGEEASGSIASDGTFAFAYGGQGRRGEGRTFAGTLGQETLTARVCQVVEEGEFPLCWWNTGRRGRPITPNFGIPMTRASPMRWFGTALTERPSGAGSLRRLPSPFPFWTRI